MRGKLLKAFILQSVELSTTPVGMSVPPRLKINVFDHHLYSHSLCALYNISNQNSSTSKCSQAKEQN